MRIRVNYYWNVKSLHLETKALTGDIEKNIMGTEHYLVIWRER